MTPPRHNPKGLGWLNALTRADAERELSSCCASAVWATVVAAGRPYPDLGSLREASGSAFANLTEVDIDQALVAHPRIGERVEGGSREAGWSRSEQSGAAGADGAARAALAAGNRAYEERFGHVFLVCATGLSAEQMLAALEARLGNDPAAERAIVREELAKIAALRLERLLTR